MRVLDLGCGDGTTALPEARLGADVLGVDIAANLVEAGNRRAKEAGLANCKFQEGDATDLRDLKDGAFDLVVSIFGAMFAPEAVRCRQGDDPSDPPRRPDRDGELDSERSDAGGANPED
jgi:SAM-dependent methyltransferase